VSTVSGPSISTVLTDMKLSQYKITLADSSTGSGLYLEYGGISQSSCLYFMAICT
jgi:hypothetical protein